MVCTLHPFTGSVHVDDVVMSGMIIGTITHTISYLNLLHVLRHRLSKQGLIDRVHVHTRFCKKVCGWVLGVGLAVRVLGWVCGSGVGCAGLGLGVWDVGVLVGCWCGGRGWWPWPWL